MPIRKKILIVDNSIDKKCSRCSQFHRHFRAETSVFHTNERPLPKNLSIYSHIVLTGSASNVNELSEIYARLYPFILRAEKAGIPMLGICFGFQAIIASFSDFSAIEHYQHPEIGWTKIKVTNNSALFDGMPKKFYAFENHISSVRHLPSELIMTAESNDGDMQAFEHKTKPIWGVQFHPEYTAHHGTLAVARWLKRRVPSSWFANKHQPPKYNPEIAEKVLYNFYNASK